MVQASYIGVRKVQDWDGKGMWLCSVFVCANEFPVQEWKCETCNGINQDCLRKNCGLFYTTIHVTDQNVRVLSSDLEPNSGIIVGQHVRLKSDGRTGNVVIASKKCPGRLTEPYKRQVRCTTMLLTMDSSHGLDLPQGFFWHLFSFS